MTSEEKQLIKECPVILSGTDAFINYIKEESAPPLGDYGQYCIPMERGYHIHMHQERGSQAVDVYKVFPGTYRESTADCGSRSSFLYAITSLISTPPQSLRQK